MSVATAFLALLGEEPMNGNQLKGAFEARTASTWPLNVGQAYTTVQRLERDGLVQSAHDDGVFELTASGRAIVGQWWTNPVGRVRPARDELAIKLTLAVTVRGVDVAAVVRAQRVESMRTLHEYTRLKATSDSTADIAWRLLLDSMIFHAEAEMRWLDHVESTVVRVAGGPRREVSADQRVDDKAATGRVS
jgi:DNA-binding PadR family transcriptional regulator